MREKLKELKEKLRSGWKSWWRGFVTKQKLSIADSDDGEVKWYMYISPARIVIGLAVVLIVMFGAVVLTIAYTPVMDTIPGYPGGRSREMLIRNIMRLDSLERRMANLTVYSDNIALIMEGKTPFIRDVSRIGDSIEITDKVMVPAGAADSVLRARMTGTGVYSLAGSEAAYRASLRTLDLVPPVQGLVQTHFSPINGRFGVEVITTANHPVAAVKGGSIILSVWTPEAGGIVQIQHSDNLVSIYKRISGLKSEVGARVKAGEIIGTAGSVSEGAGATGPLEFELWYNGTPVDPENYITF